MAEPNADNRAQTRSRWLALSRWDNEGGASPSRPTSGWATSAGTSIHRSLTKELSRMAPQIGIAADHGGFALKNELAWFLRACASNVADFGRSVSMTLRHLVS